MNWRIYEFWERLLLWNLEFKKRKEEKIMGIFKKLIKIAQEEEDKNAKDFEIRGIRQQEKWWDGDDIELEDNGKDKYNPDLNNYSVLHEDHVIGWISAPYSLEKFEDNEDLKLIFKDGKLFVRYIPYRS